jgi:1-acyl-sn-glycerol-3-phosphate acyltransferase
MIQLDSLTHTDFETSETSKIGSETSKIVKVAPYTSSVSPWLAPLAYTLVGDIAIPFYFGQIEVTGQVNLPTSGPVILAPTHRSYWDSLFVAYATGRRVTGRDPRFMVSVDHCKGVKGWFIRHLGGFPVDTTRPAITTLRHGVKVLQQKEMLVIFPEGNIFRDGYVHPLKPGIARLALSAESSQPELGVKIIPIGIRYSQTFPQWGCDVNLCIGSPLVVANYHQGSMKQDAKHLTRDLELALKELSGQIKEEHGN